MAKTNLKLIKAQKAIEEAPQFDSSADLADRIKTAIDTMEDRGLEALTYPEIAELCSVSRKNIWNWAREGQVSKEKMPLLCAVLGISIEWLLTGSEPDKGSFDPIEQDRFQRTTMGIGGELAETIIPIPIRELDDFLQNLSPSLPLTPDHLDWLTSTRGTRTMAINVLQADHPYVPTWCFQMCATTFSPALTEGAFLLMTHRVIPKDNDFCCYLYKRNGRFQIVSGYASWRDTQMHHASLGADYTRTLMTQDLRLMRQPHQPSENDIILKGTDDPDRISRRLLGTLVMVQEWIHWTSLHGQTRLIDRKKLFEEKLALDWAVTQGVLFQDQAEID